MPGLFPSSVVEAATRLRDGTLTGERIERNYSGDDPNVLPFLKAVAAGDEARAFLVLGRLLRLNPRLIEHPYVWSQFRHLFTVWHPFDPELMERATQQLIGLIKAWAQGMTLGWKVSIKAPAQGRRGQSSEMFPHLGERDGWLPTDAALADQTHALEFRRLYDDLLARLPTATKLRSFRSRARNRKASLLNLEDAIRRAFSEFIRDAGISRAPFGNLRDIARRGLEERAGGNPRHKMACALLAELPWYGPAGHPLKLRAGLVESSLETLRRHGIGKAKA